MRTVRSICAFSTTRWPLRGTQQDVETHLIQVYQERAQHGTDDVQVKSIKQSVAYHHSASAILGTLLGLLHDLKFARVHPRLLMTSIRLAFGREVLAPDLLRSKHATKFEPILSLYTRTIRWLWRTQHARCDVAVTRHGPLSLTPSDADTTRAHACTFLKRTELNGTEMQ